MVSRLFSLPLLASDSKIRSVRAEGGIGDDTNYLQLSVICYANVIIFDYSRLLSLDGRETSETLIESASASQPPKSERNTAKQYRHIRGGVRFNPGRVGNV